MIVIWLHCTLGVLSVLDGSRLCYPANAIAFLISLSSLLVDIDLHQKSMIFDLHMHSIVLPASQDHFMGWFSSYRPKMGLEGIKKGGITAMFDGFSSISQFYTKWDFDGVIREIGLRLCDIDHAYD